MTGQPQSCNPVLNPAPSPARQVGDGAPRPVASTVLSLTWRRVRMGVGGWGAGSTWNCLMFSQATDREV